jgi:hypothetical protein
MLRLYSWSIGGIEIPNLRVSGVGCQGRKIKKLKPV